MHLARSYMPMYNYIQTHTYTTVYERYTLVYILGNLNVKTYKVSKLVYECKNECFTFIGDDYEKINSKALTKVNMSNKVIMKTT